MARALVFARPAGIIRFDPTDPVTFRLKGRVDSFDVHQGGMMCPHFLSSSHYGLWMRLYVQTQYATLNETLIVEKSIKHLGQYNVLVRVRNGERVLHHQKYFFSSSQEVHNLF